MHDQNMLNDLKLFLYMCGLVALNTASPWAQRGHRAPPPPRILHEWYHFVQGTPLINNRDINAL